MTLRRIAVGVGAGAASATLMAAAVAFACVPSARISLSTGSGRPGDTVMVSGASFGVPVNATNPVQLRWNDYGGALLGEVRPTPDGNFSVSVTVPDGAPGAYTVMAVWYDDEGNTGAGTPARAVFEILVPGATATTLPFAGSDPEPAPVPAAPPSSTSSFPVGLVIGLGVLGIVLLGAGLATASRSRSRSATPARARRG